MLSSYENPTLERWIEGLGGPFAAAAALWPGVPRKRGYDRVLQALRRGRVPGTWLGDLVRVGRSVGLHPTDDELSALGGSSLEAASGPSTTSRRKYPTRVHGDSETARARRDAA